MPSKLPSSWSDEGFGLSALVGIRALSAPLLVGYERVWPRHILF